MFQIRLRDLCAAGAFAGAIALGGNGCSSSSTSGGPAADAAADTGTLPIHRSDASPPGITADSGGDDSATSGLFDGTVGAACKTDTDCKGANGPGVNRCSLNAFLAGPLLPTPVCLLLACDPGSDGFLHYCDGPDAPSSPGICLGTGAVGTCLPKCDMLADGKPAAGCLGKDACNFVASGLTTANQLVGLGICYAGCTADADCPTGSKCQTDQGTCVTTVQPPSKAPGVSCNATDSQGGACNCYFSSAANVGYCAPFCLVGSSTATCPAGFTCDSQEPAVINRAGDAGVAGFATQNAGLLGFCLATCGGDAGAPPIVVAEAGAGEGGAEAGMNEGGVEAGGSSSEAGAASWYPGGPCPKATICSSSDTAGMDCLLP